MASGTSSKGAHAFDECIFENRLVPGAERPQAPTQTNPKHPVADE
jgi:hypothetical protein